jgi:hypothetical protein
MTFARALLLGAFLWGSGITFLHAWLNWGSFDRTEEVGTDADEGEGSQGRGKKFRVGFLPVT